MPAFTYAIFVSVFFVGFLSRYGLSLRQFNLLPDLLSAGVMVGLIFVAARTKMTAIAPVYLALFLLLIVEMICGVVYNGVEETTVFAAIRKYFKYLPFFLLPAVYRFSPDQIMKLLKFLWVIAFVQVPVALFQRFVEGRTDLYSSGDVVRGTLETSSILSIFLIGAMALMLAFYLRKKLSLAAFLVSLAVLFIPIALNETQGSLFLLPLALLLPALFAAGGQPKTKTLVSMAALLALLLTLVTTVYSHFYGDHKFDFLTDKNQLEWYLIPQASGVAEHRTGRGDVVLAPFKELSSDPARLLLGLGVGNVSVSFLGEKFDGTYTERYGDLTYLSISNLMWETGVIGTVLVLSLIAAVFADAWRIRAWDGLAGIVASGWIGVVLIYCVSFFYKNVFFVDSLSYTFWFLSGYLAAERWCARSIPGAGIERTHAPTPLERGAKRAGFQY